MATDVTIDVFSDVVCPWCLIGKRRLERALAALDGEVRAELRFLPFELNPDLPKEGMARADYLAAKFGGPDRAEAVYERVVSAAASDGLELAFDRIARQPNTFDAHRLIAAAHGERVGPAVKDRLMQGYFQEGRDLGDPATLAELAAEAGMDRAVAEELLAGDAYADEVRAYEKAARDVGVTGVPFFILDGKLGVSGAQPPETLVDAIRQAVAPS
ncbi:DsbA family oxidoreductase [Marinivivus vitaminiproducens]|uniref:DsbA family oxidoreductase n=1 Tax=Marinivivus vitaminiproducens TaxID=3035935 RepID=UPI00279FA504|nr:DsbA family oxidoreductase [Geminicoccaceae bacterium SCSIO 64248]